MSAGILVIWYGNLPRETGFLLDRTKGSWAIVAILVLLMNFVTPFIVLMPRPAKKNPKILLGTALVIAAGMWLERFLLVVPSISQGEAFHVGWQEIMITAGFGASFLLTCLGALPRTRIESLRTGNRSEITISSATH